MAGRSFIHVDGEQLKQLYEVERLTCYQIADRLGLSVQTVVRRLHRFGIAIRAKGPEQLRDGAWLAKQYATKSTIQIGAEVGVTPRVVLTWLRKHGIQSKPRCQNHGRTRSAESRQKQSVSRTGKLTGESHPLWKGDEAKKPNRRLRSHRTTVEWSLAVRERDGHKCVECGATGKLHAHHIKPWKTHPELRHDVSNGETLCPPCHQKAHGGWKFPAWVYTENAARAQGTRKSDEIV